MKRFIISGFILIFSAAIVSAGEERFYNALLNCSLYSESGQINTDGMNIKFRNQILGWDNGKCTYKEYVTAAGIDSCTTCQFSKKQINELVKVMSAYSTVQRYSGERPNLSNMSEVQKNPVVNVWNKYLQDSSVCTIELSQ